MAMKSVTALPLKVPQEKYSANVGSGTNANCKYTATGTRGDFETDASLLFVEGMSVLDGLHECIGSDEGEVALTPRAFSSMLFGAQRLLQMAWAASNAAACEEELRRAQA